MFHGYFRGYIPMRYHHCIAMKSVKNLSHINSVNWFSCSYPTKYHHYTNIFVGLMFVFHGEIPWHSHNVHGIPWLTYISHYSGTYPAIFPYFFLKFPNHQKFGAWTAFMACEWEFCQQMWWKNGSKWGLTSQEVNLTKQRWEFNYHKWELNGNRTQLSNITYLKISWWFTFKKMSCSIAMLN